MTSTFGARLREIRESKQLTQIDAAKLFSVSNSAYSLYERGKREPSFDVLRNICGAFDVSVDYLLGLSDTPQRTAVSIRPMSVPRDPYADLTPDQRTTIVAALHAFRAANAASTKEGVILPFTPRSDDAE